MSQKASFLVNTLYSKVEIVVSVEIVFKSLVESYWILYSNTVRNVGRKTSVFQRSCNRSRKKKINLFKKGVSGSRTSNRSDGEVPGVSATESGSRIGRLAVREAMDTVEMCGGSETGLPYKLRSKSVKEISSIVPDGPDAHENIIANMGKISDLIGNVHSAMCRHPAISTKVTKRIGLCIYLSVECTYCGFKTPSFPMSQTIKKPGRGPPMGALNSMAVLPVLKTKVGLEDIVTVLACLNIKAPCKSTLQVKLNAMADCAIEVNEQQMSDNQQYVARMLTLAGKEPSADVQFDVAYTCRPQGGSEKAAQSFGALVEHSTPSKLPIAIATANKHCKIKGCKHVNCKKNFKSEDSISTSERSLLHNTLDSVERAGHLGIKSITTDSGTQSAKAIRDYYSDKRREAAVHYKCLVHKLRSLEKHIKQLNLKSIPKKYDKVAYTRKLASSVRIRVRQELTKLRKESKSDEQFIKMASWAVNNITKCFSGNHRLCRANSRVCTSHLDPNYSHLPYKEPLKLSENDLDEVETKLNKLFDAGGLQDVCRLYNTNICESTNAAVFNYAPKSTCWIRNFEALCHSATHSKTVGPGKGTLQLASAYGININQNPIMYKKLIAKDRLRLYHKLRKASAKYKIARHYNRKRKCNKSLFKDSLYSSENVASTSAADHAYGLTK